MIHLAWSHNAFVEEASQRDTLSCACAGVAAMMVITLLPVAASIGSIDEPYRELGVYFYKSFSALPYAFVFLSLFWSAILGLVAVPFTHGTDGPDKGMMRRIVLLSPLTLLIPGVIWSVFAALNEYAHPHQGFTGPGGKPAWLNSAIIAILGSNIWILVGLACLVSRCRRARMKISQFVSSDDCSQCGYNLTGNESGICPECGVCISHLTQ